MLKRLVNECRFDFSIETKGPFIIREGRMPKSDKKKDDQKKEKTAPNSIPIRRVWHDNPKRDLIPSQSYYIPGTSLRGVMRSQVERIVRSSVTDRLLCCDPLRKQQGPEEGCSFWLDRQPNRGPKTGHAYKHSCVVCRLFGSTGQASRIRVADSADVLVPPQKMSYRDHIGIDRFTGGVCHRANFRDLVIEAGVSFKHTVSIRNFELWQLGLLAFLLRDFYCWEDGIVRMGYGKSKGYGLVQGVVGDITLTCYGRPDLASPPLLSDLGDEMSKEEREVYDLKPGGNKTIGDLQRCGGGFYHTIWKVSGNNAFWQAAAQAWLDRRDDFKSLDQLRASGAGEEQAAAAVPDLVAGTEEQP